MKWLNTLYVKVFDAAVLGAEKIGAILIVALDWLFTVLGSLILCILITIMAPLALVGLLCRTLKKK